MVLALVALALSLAAWWAVGPNLGFALAGVVIVGAMVPAAAAAGERTWRWRAMSIAGIVLGVAIVWPMVFAMPAALKAAAVLGAYGLALAGLSAGLPVPGRAKVSWAAAVTMLGLAYLSWPVWAAPLLRGEGGGRAVRLLVPAHPVFVLNKLLDPEQMWTERSLAYYLTNLGDDIPYRLPEGIGSALAVHGGIGLAALAAAGAVAKLRGRVVRGDGA